MRHELEIDRLSRREMINLAREIDRKIERAESAEFSALMRMLAQMERLSHAKYVSPKNQTVVWSGNGRRPKWLNDYISSGGNLKDLLI